MVHTTKGSKKLKNIKKQRAKYPSLAKKIVEVSDIILEVLDARFIAETRNYEFEEFAEAKGKKIIYVLNKADLIDKKNLNKEELEEVKPYVLVSSTRRKGSVALRNLIKREARQIEKPVSEIVKGGEILEAGNGRVVVGIIGYPNTGKSSLINFLIGKSSAGVGSDAGFTRNMQKLRLTADIMLLDTPGVIPKKEYSSSDPEAIARHTKVGGRSYSQVKEPEIVVANLIKDIPGVLEKFYKIEADGDAEVLIEELGKQKGFMKKGDKVNEDKTARLILKDWQSGKIRI